MTHLIKDEPKTIAQTDCCRLLYANNWNQVPLDPTSNYLLYHKGTLHAECFQDGSWNLLDGNGAAIRTGCNMLDLFAALSTKR